MFVIIIVIIVKNQPDKLAEQNIIEYTSIIIIVNIITNQTGIITIIANITNQTGIITIIIVTNIQTGICPPSPSTPPSRAPPRLLSVASTPR